MTIVEFLLARIAEDEAEADRVLYDIGGGDLDTLKPEVLARCRAWRAIIEHETSPRTMHQDVPWHSATFTGMDGYALYSEHGSLIATGEDADRLIEQYSDPVADTPVLRILAAVHADHPEYDPAWRP